jgi:hypothetical protein
MDPGTATNQQDAGEDIFFDCPNCGQNMSIDGKAAGLIVNCRGCSNKVQIPQLNTPRPPAVPAASESPDNQARILLESLSSSQARIQEITEKYNEVQRRRAFLERMRVENLHLFNEINQHLEQIRASCDRLTEIMQDAP